MQIKVCSAHQSDRWTDKQSPVPLLIRRLYTHSHFTLPVIHVDWMEINAAIASNVSDVQVDHLATLPFSETYYADKKCTSESVEVRTNAEIFMTLQILANLSQFSQFAF